MKLYEVLYKIGDYYLGIGHVYDDQVYKTKVIANSLEDAQKKVLESIWDGSGSVCKIINT